MSRHPFILGLGGTTRANSSSEMALRMALAEAEKLGAETAIMTGPELVLPLYAPENPAREPAALRLVDLLRRCDGVILASPGYHGSISGLMKNALDYVEDMARDPLPYLDGRAVGSIACAYGWQATGSTLAAMRSITHALRAWPTPLGVAINSMGTKFAADGTCSDAPTAGNLSILTRQVVWFAQTRVAMRDAAA